MANAFVERENKGKKKEHHDEKFNVSINTQMEEI
jgi:hypothetical protein